MKLDSKQRHILRLVSRSSDCDGWAPVSGVVWPLIELLPDKLVEKKSLLALGEGGYVRLTDHGKLILRSISK